MPFKGARAGDAIAASPCQGVPYIQTVPLLFRRMIRSSLRIMIPPPPPPPLGFFPTPAHGGFPGARLTDKQIALSVRSDHPAGVDFHSVSCRQQMDEQEFIQRVFERV